MLDGETDTAAPPATMKPASLCKLQASADLTQLQQVRSRSGGQQLLDA
jgi:hypothetical protein